jgi:GMP synthase-like glutamine amidotransferase
VILENVRVLAIVNQRDAGPGVFAEAAVSAGHELIEWTPSDDPPPVPDSWGAAIVLGGAMNVDQEDEHPWLREEKEFLSDLLDRGSPLLGVCLGAQLLAEAAGGAAGRAERPEIGWHEVELTGGTEHDPVIGGLPERFEAFQWHSYEATPPDEAVSLARSPVCVQAYRAGERAWGVQFHAEVTQDTVSAWLADYRKDMDAVRLGLDPPALRAETRERIGRWNELGRGLCARFLAAATRE